MFLEKKLTVAVVMSTPAEGAQQPANLEFSNVQHLITAFVIQFLNISS